MHAMVFLTSLFLVALSYGMELPAKKRKLNEAEVALGSEDVFIGHKPEELEAYLDAIQSGLKQPIALELWGLPKSGKKLLINYVAQQLGTSLLYKKNWIDFWVQLKIWQSKKAIENFDDACQEFLESELATLTCSNHCDSKYAIFLFDRAEQIIEKEDLLSISRQEGIAKGLSLFVEQEKEKKILLIMLSKEPFLEKFFQRYGNGGATVLRSIEIKIPSYKDRIRLWNHFLSTAKDFFNENDVENFAKKTDDFTGYDIKQIAFNSTIDINYRKKKEEAPDLVHIVEKNIKNYCSNNYSTLYALNYSHSTLYF